MSSFLYVPIIYARVIKYIFLFFEYIFFYFFLFFKVNIFFVFEYIFLFFRVNIFLFSSKYFFFIFLERLHNLVQDSVMAMNLHEFGAICSTSKIHFNAIHIN